MVERIANALLEQPGDPRDHRLAQVLADDVAAQRQRKPGLLDTTTAPRSTTLCSPRSP